MKKKVLLDGIKGKIRRKEPLSRHTTFRIGGPAQFFIEPRDSGDLKTLIIWVRIHKIPLLVIGAGSNILASDKGMEACVVRLSTPFFKKISFSRDRLDAGSGLSLTKLLGFARSRSLSGLEFLVGIPGTVGGALIMNAGAWGANLGNLVEKVKVMDYNGKIKVLGRDKIRFAYRKSSLASSIILSVRLKLSKKTRKEISGRIKKYRMLRHNTQDQGLASAGCVFRNPVGFTAGRLIESCGLKGKRRGDAVVSKRHANFILNQHSARCQDVLNLMDLIKKKVRKKFHIHLEPEIKIWR
ncbi:MAG: UDP-N-acetylmuramate dehydrogenase [Candidatus Omnitrophota bacterium]